MRAYKFTFLSWNQIFPIDLSIDQTLVMPWSGFCHIVLLVKLKELLPPTYLIIVADAADAVSVNFSGRCKFLQI